MLVAKMSNVYSMFVERGWREIIIRLDQSLGTQYFDFSPVKTLELGLDPERSNAYRGSAKDVCHILHQLGIAPGSSIIDIGAGKGRAMVAMARFPFETIAGVEISPALTEAAKRNFKRAFLNNRTEMTTSCASVFDDYDTFTYFYFYNPFPVEVLRDVMVHIRSSLLNKPREAWLIYNAATDVEVDKIICMDGVISRTSEHRPEGRRPLVVYRHHPEDQVQLT